MQKKLDCLLLVPPFWDPICVPLGVSSLNSHLRSHNVASDIFDFNTVPEIFGLQQKYFSEILRQFPKWQERNIYRNGTELLCLHQLIYLKSGRSKRFEGFSREILEIEKTGRLHVPDLAAFIAIFNELFRRVFDLTGYLLKQHSPSLLGLSLYNSSWPATTFICEVAKRLDPNIRTVVGGPGPTMGISAKPKEIDGFLAVNPAIDHYVLGEGEEALLAIARATETFPRVLTSASATSTIRFKGKPSLGISLHELSPPDYGSLETDRYINLSVATSRGCPYECSFCAETVFWKGFRSVRRSDVLRHFDHLAQRYGSNSFYICDSLSNHIINPLTEATVAGRRKYLYDCYLRADASCGDKSLAHNWYQGGLRRARLGMESASQRILDEMVKKTDTQKMSQALDALASAKIQTSTLWIIGYPGESEEEFKDTLHFIGENRQNIYQSDAWLFQFSSAGLAGSDKLSRSGTRSRFSRELEELIGVRYEVPEDGISRDERLDRLRRFTARMRDLDIPNPYSLSELHAADRRWNAPSSS